jgi:O-antigen ligase
MLSAGARSALLSLIVAGAIVVYVNRQHVRMYAAAGVMLAGMLAFVHIPELALEYLGTLIHSDDPLNWRGHLMMKGIELTVDSPLLGVGVGGFPYYGKESTPAEWFLYNWPHNVFIEISAEWGLPSALLMLALIIVAVVDAARLAFARERRDKGMAAAVLALLVIGFITFLITGDINDNRPLFCYLALPFVLRRALAGRMADADDPAPALPIVASTHPTAMTAPGRAAAIAARDPSAASGSGVPSA